MASREIDNIFVKVDVDLSHFRKGFQEISKIINEVSRELNGLNTQLNSMSFKPPNISGVKGQFDSLLGSMKSVANTAKSIGGEMTTKITLPLTLIGASAIKSFTEYEHEILRAKTVTGATTKEFSEMKDMVKDLGQKTEFSVNDSAKALTNLGQRGFSAGDAMKSLPNIMNLSTAGAIELEDAASITAQVMNSMGLQMKDVAIITDVLTKTGNTTGASIKDLGSSFARMGSSAETADQNIYDVAAAMGLLRDRGTDAGTIGTEMRNIFSKLSTSAKDNVEVLKQYNLQLYKSNGNLKPLPDLVEEFTDKLHGLTAPEIKSALMELMDRRTAEKFQSLMQDGADAIRKLSSSIEESGGVADKTAKSIRDGLWFEISKLSSTINTTFNNAIETIAPLLIDVIKVVGGLAKAFTNLSPEIKKAIIGFTILLGVIGPVLFLFGTGLGAITLFAGAIASLPTTIGLVSGAFAILLGRLSTVLIAMTSLKLSDFAFSIGGVGKALLDLGGSIKALLIRFAPLLTSLGLLATAFVLIVVAAIMIVGAWDDLVIAWEMLKNLFKEKLIDPFQSWIDSGGKFVEILKTVAKLYKSLPKSKDNMTGDDIEKLQAEIDRKKKESFEFDLAVKKSTKPRPIIKTDPKTGNEYNPHERKSIKPEDFQRLFEGPDERKAEFNSVSEALKSIIGDRKIREEKEAANPNKVKDTQKSITEKAVETFEKGFDKIIKSINDKLNPPKVPEDTNNGGVSEEFQSFKGARGVEGNDQEPMTYQKDVDAANKFVEDMKTNWAKIIEVKNNSLQIMSDAWDAYLQEMADKERAQLEESVLAWTGFSIAVGAILSSIKEASSALFQAMAEGMANAVAQMIVYGASFKEMMMALWKQVAAAAIKALIMIAIQAAITAIFSKTAVQSAGAGIIKTYAGEAHAAGVASWSAAPWPINAGAPIFGAAMGAAAMLGMGYLGAAEEGGIINGHGLVEVGEKGKKEIIQPLEGSNKVNNGNQTIVIQLDEHVLTSVVAKGMPEFLRLNMGGRF